MSTADAFLTISDEKKKEFFLMACQESEELKRARERILFLADGLADMQRHRDHWRQYALGERKDRPSNYLGSPAGTDSSLPSQPDGAV
jgi:hypothetical protein